MSQPRYQIFVSSTFRDLQDERQAVLNAILKLNQFPAGMEIFPAVDDTAWQHIEKVIEESDYYVLIIGGKYGSIEEESRISYTEKEYDFAVSKNIPVLAFTHGDETSIPSGKVEMDPEIREKLKEFKKKVGNKHHWNYWKNNDELKAIVLSSLAMAFAMNPQKGWVKAGGVERSELLERLAELQKKYDELLEENNKLQSSTETFSNFAQGNDSVFIKLVDVDNSEIQVEITWDEIFLSLAEDMLLPRFTGYIMSDIYKLLIEKYLHKSYKDYKSYSESSKHSLKAELKYKLNDEEFSRIRNQFLALDLIDFFEIDHGWYWKLTETGKRYYLNNSAIQRS